MPLTERRFPPVLDSTMISSWSCPQKFRRAYLHRYSSSAEESIHLKAGKAFAKGLEVARLTYHRTNDAEEALLQGTGALIVEYGDEPIDHGTAKSLDRMIGAMEFYLASAFPLDTDDARIALIGGVPAVEWSFGLPLPFNHPDTDEPLLYAGRTDAIVDFAGGTYALDDKTTSQLGHSWSKQWELRGQFSGYAWAGRELGIKLSGTLVRGVSILKTKYESAQAIVNQPNWKIDRWVEHRDRTIRAMLEAYRTNSFDFALGEDCNAYGGCTFKPVCNVPPEHEVQWLTSNYHEREWSPLHNVKD
jgi:hypothetical protein